MLTHSWLERLGPSGPNGDVVEELDGGPIIMLMAETEAVCS